MSTSLPRTQPKTPTKQTSSPTKQSTSPIKQTVPPVKQPISSIKQTVPPVKQSPAKQTVSPVKPVTKQTLPKVSDVDKTRPVKKTPPKFAKTTAERISQIKHLKAVQDRRIKQEYGIAETIENQDEEDERNYREERGEQDEDEPDYTKEMEEEPIDAMDEEQPWQDGDTPLEAYDFIEEQPIHQIDDTIAAMGKLYKSKNIRHKALFKFVSGTICEYPLKTDKRCLACKRQFDTVPVHIPVKFDEKTKAQWSLDPAVQCSIVCAIEIIFSRRKSNMSQRLGLLCRFTREYFNFGFDKITYVSIQCVEGFCDNPVMTLEQYYNSCGTVTVLVKQPTCMFIDTWAEEQDSTIREEQRKKEFERLLNTKTTPEQQATFRSTMQRIVNQYQGINQSIENSPIGEALGIKENGKNKNK